MKNYKYLLLLVSLYTAALIAGDTLTYEMVTISTLVVSGSVFIFPLTYAINDIVTEVYGLKIAQQSIVAGIIAEGLFDLICGFVPHLPHPITWHDGGLFLSVLGPLPRIYFSALLGLIAGFFVNSLLINKTKLMTKGRLFWLRSIFSTLIGEGIFLIIFYLMAFGGKMSIAHIFSLIGNSYITKIIFACIVAYPANLIVNFLKKQEAHINN